MSYFGLIHILTKTLERSPRWRERHTYLHLIDEGWSPDDAAGYVSEMGRF